MLCVVANAFEEFRVNGMAQEPIEGGSRTSLTSMSTDELESAIRHSCKIEDDAKKRLRDIMDNMMTVLKDENIEIRKDPSEKVQKAIKADVSRLCATANKLFGEIRLTCSFSQQITASKEAFEKDAKSRCIRITKAVDGLRPRVQSLKTGETAAHELRQLKLQKVEAHQEIINLESTIEKEQERYNKLQQQIVNTKKEMQQKISALEKKIAADNAVLMELSSASKKAEAALASERKQHKQQAAALQKRIRHAEEVSRKALDGSLFET
ncbi:hypothetical protein L596_023781 [Steinernema carpocapsae]|uniref:Uncharacterized protein n=1 Tax=Steinernema carpocapsae TaxID=34508 RepID=A0A4V6XVU7_STECR|nr:hypothetical protein L596_023781 [Steinernema carpocapsae]